MTAVATEVKERPILFSGPMVRAILEGRKSMTRRVVKLPKISMWQFWTGFWQPEYPEDYEIKPGTWLGAIEFDTFDGRQYDECVIGKCPYGQIGDRLWVRETFSYITKAKNEYHDKVRPDGCPVEMLYRADYPGEEMPMNWTPSIFMPRWASRITLEVTGVKVERLQQITEQDALAEGVYTNEEALKKLGLPGDTKLSGSAVDKFRIVWDSINGKKYPWASNPFVWIVEFRKV